MASMRAPLLLTLVFTLAPPATAQEPAPLEVHFLGLETHGESILVRTPGGRAVLIDGGLPQAGPAVARYLQEVGVRELDLVISTHDDPDHFGGLPLVLAAISAAELWESPVRAGGLRGALRADLERAVAQHRIVRREVAAGARRELEPGVTLEVLAPREPWFSRPGRDEPNADSLVLRLTHGEARFLLTGDLTAAAERRLAASGVELACEVLKVPHHGIEGSTSAPLLEAARPRLAVICCAPGSPGVPAPAVLERLAERDVPWWRTDRNGAVVVRSRGERASLEVSAARGGASEPGASPRQDAAALLARYARWPRFTPPRSAWAGRMGGEVFHRAACLAYRLTPRSRRITFASPDEAAARGRAPCLLCQPAR